MFFCVVCYKTFNTKRNMKRHENTHTGIRFSCEKCNANFTYKTNLTCHVKKIHPTTELPSSNQHRPSTQTGSDYILDDSDDIYDNSGNNFNLYRVST